VTLDDIEHRILRPTFREPLVHFAVNCASVSCPPLAPEPYRAIALEAQLHAAARRFLASPPGLTLRGTRLSVSSIFKWYGDDFVERAAMLSQARVPRSIAPFWASSPRSTGRRESVAETGRAGSASCRTTGHSTIPALKGARPMTLHPPFVVEAWSSLRRRSSSRSRTCLWRRAHVGRARVSGLGGVSALVFSA
jgi:hypothetical protein